MNCTAAVFSQLRMTAVPVPPCEMIAMPPHLLLALSEAMLSSFVQESTVEPA